MYQRISEFRHTAKFETRNAALVCLLNAGLAALARPATVPPPVRPKRLVSFVGSEARPLP
jgi:hypothetical protein